MDEEQKNEIKRLVHAEVRNALERVLVEQEKVAEKVVEEAISKVVSEYDMIFGKQGRKQMAIEDTLDSIKGETDSIREEIKYDKKIAKEILEKITKLEYITLDSEAVSKVRSFIKSPVKYIIKTVAGIE